jgi:hypothetical protein
VAVSTEKIIHVKPECVVPRVKNALVRSWWPEKYQRRSSQHPSCTIGSTLSTCLRSFKNIWLYQAFLPLKQASKVLNWRQGQKSDIIHSAMFSKDYTKVRD